MMTIGGTAHISMLIASLVLSLFLFWFVAKSKEKVQYIMITIVGLIAVVGIFFLHGTHYFTKLDFYNLGKQMFQVCNFNFLLIPLALFQKNELARQYLFYFYIYICYSYIKHKHSLIFLFIFYHKIILFASTK